MPQWRVEFELFRRGVELFNQGEFFEAHEALEDVWRAAPLADKRFLQGLIQIAVALHHHGHENLEGARSVMRRAFRNISLYPPGFGGIDSASLLLSVADWLRYLDEGGLAPALPRILAIPS